MFMFEKKKIDIDVTKQMNETIVCQDKNGNDVNILKYISAADKEAFAIELVTLTMGTNEALGLTYVIMTEEQVENYLFVKYYTNIDVSEIEDTDGFRKLFDYCQLCGLKQAMESAICEDERNTIFRMVCLYREAIRKLYEAEHSLGYAVKQLLNTDVDTNNKETRELIEKLIDMKGALIEKEEEGKVLQFGKKKPASIKTGGAKMNLAKK